MVRACREAGVKLGVGYHLRQHPGQRAAQRLIAQGVLGTVALAQGQWGFGVRGQAGLLGQRRQFGDVIRVVAVVADRHRSQTHDRAVATG